MIVSVCSFFSSFLFFLPVFLLFLFSSFFFSFFFYFYLCCSPETSTVYYTAYLRSQPTTFTASSQFNSIQLIPYRGYIYTYTCTHLVHYPPIHPIEHVTQASHSQRRLTPVGLEISLTSPRLSSILYPPSIYTLNYSVYTQNGPVQLRLHPQQR